MDLTLKTLALTVALSANLASATEAMDHSTHGAAPRSTTEDQPATQGAPDHSSMNNGQMDHSQMQHADNDQPAPRPALPVITDADRAAAFPPLPGHGMHGKSINGFVLLDQFEYQDADAGSTLSWDASGWIGGDIDRLWLRSEGERTAGVTEEAEVQALWGHAIGPWWDLLAGIRQDFQPGAPQTWAAFGLQGMALYGFEAEATAFVGENGQTSLRLEGDYDILLSNRLILQPTAELNVYGKNDPERGIGSGLADTEVGLRLRYELVREFAPYIGVTWQRTYGNTAELADDEDEARLVAGIRMWF